MSEPEKPLYDDHPIHASIERAEQALQRLYARRGGRFVLDCGSEEDGYEPSEWRWCACGRHKLVVPRGEEAHCEKC